MKKAFLFSLIIIFLVLGFSVAGKFHQTIAQADLPPFRGLFSMNSLLPNSNRTGRLFHDEVYQNPIIRGVYFRTSWHSIQPDSEDEYDWSRIDEVFNKAEQNNKLVQLLVIPGAYSPPWALEGVETDTFPVPYGPDEGQMRLHPMPWDEVYLSRWFEFLEALQERYGERPSFAKIYTTGPTSITGEMTLPPWWHDDPESLEKWRQHGYTPERLVNAWKQALDKHYQLFAEKQYFSLAICPTLPIPTEEDRFRVPREVITYAVNNYPSLFILQHNGLNTAFAPGRMYLLVKEFSDRVQTGFQMATSATAFPEQMGDPDPVKALRLSIEKGLETADIDFLEIYVLDIRNPDMQETLAWAASAFNPNFLNSGWNQIIWSDIANYTAKTALEDIDADCGAGTGLAVARKTKDFWEEYVVGYGGEGFGLEGGMSYHVKVSKNCNWNP